VNSIFGEGVSPKLRKLRDGIDRLGWPSNDLLQHRRERIVYGVCLIANLRDYLLGIDPRPRYVFRDLGRDDGERIVDWWIERWLSRRARSDEILERVGRDTLTRPVRHRARVVIPNLDLRDAEDWEDLGSLRDRQHLVA
jgi:hypothetical protein